MGPVWFCQLNVSLALAPAHSLSRFPSPCDALLHSANALPSPRLLWPSKPLVMPLALNALALASHLDGECLRRRLERHGGPPSLAFGRALSLCRPYLPLGRTRLQTWCTPNSCSSC